MIQTVIVQSNVHTGGLRPDQQAEVEYNAEARALIERGFWTLLVPIEPPAE